MIVKKKKKNSSPTLVLTELPLCIYLDIRTLSIKQCCKWNDEKIYTQMKMKKLLK